MEKLTIVFTVVICLSVPALAVDTYWQGGTGYWFEPANWDNGVPTSTAAAYLDNGTAMLSTGVGQTADIYVGDSATSVLEIAGGAELRQSKTFPAALGYIGNQPGSSGKVVVDGPGSKWDLNLSGTGRLLVGRYGTGELQIAGGGSVITNYGYIGYREGAEGLATVDGVNSTLNIEGYFYLGLGETAMGELRVTNQGMVSAGPTFLGHSTATEGTIVVDGAGTVFDSSIRLEIGELGQGLLQVTNGGFVSSGETGISHHATGSGLATVDGDGSVWNQYQLTVGYGGTGVLEITNGGSVTVMDELHIGTYHGDTSMVSVRGAGSRCAASALYVGGYEGRGGLGEMAVSDGASVAVDDLYISEVGDIVLSNDGTVTIGTGSVETSPDTLRIWSDGKLHGNGIVHGDVINAGTLHPTYIGDPLDSTLEIDGDYTQDETGTLQIWLIYADDVLYDVLAVTGEAVLDGALEITTLQRHEATLGRTFEIMTFASRIGEFSMVTGLEIVGSDLYYDIDYGDTNITLTVVSEPTTTPPTADADGPYSIYVGDTLTLDASGSTDPDNDIASFIWDLDDDENFETDAGGEAVFDVDYAYLQSLGLIVDHTYIIHLKVTDSKAQSDTADSTLIIVPKPALWVAVDIKPGSCPNPLNVKSSGVLPVAILGTADVNVLDIDPASIQLAGVGTIRSSYEDVATPVSDGNECACTDVGPDGYMDLALKFSNQEIVEELIRTEDELSAGQELKLTLTGVLFDETPIEGTDCVVLVGNVPRHLFVRISDINGNGVINMVDLAQLAMYWLESYEVEY